jgi:excisionase family DNA binding protein
VRTAAIQITNNSRRRNAWSDDALLTVHDVAKILRVGPSWVYEHTRERCRGRIPGIRLGKDWRFVEADVLAWLAAKRTNN